MTVRRASYLGLVGLVAAVWAIAVGCNLEATGFGQNDDLCGEDAHCDDDNACTGDACGDDGVCVHTPVEVDTVPDGVQGNCKIYACQDGEQVELYFAGDIDDGNDCTSDACDEDGGVITAVHDNRPKGAACLFHGVAGACDGAGACVAECGFIGEDGAEVGCPMPPNACTLSYCDKGKGVCVVEKLDGIASPGSSPGECGGSYCVDGEETTLNASQGTPCIQVGGVDDGKSGVCSGAGACIGCNTKDDCADAIPESQCHQWVCAGGTCMNTTEQDGPLASQVIGDCKLKTCAGGVYVEQLDITDTEDDGNDCTTDVCTGGIPGHVPTPINSPCGVGLVCNGTGTCQGCNVDGQCGGGTECKIPKCNAGTGDCFLDYEPAGKIITTQTAGDCINNVCDANGNITTAYNDQDPQDDGVDCTIDVCTAMNQTAHNPAAYGSSCNDNGGTVCDASTHCVGKSCSVAADCAAGTFCVDGRCCDSTCGGTCQACSAGKKGMGPNGLCGVIVSTDPDNECPGKSSCGSGVCVPLANGAACDNVAGECQSGSCTDGVCCNVACNGTCLTCASPAGTCTPIANGQDPANECASGACDGTGACRKNNGQTCANGSECLSNICADGVCCGTTCGGVCEACNLSGTMGTCTKVPNTEDPANECANGACNGLGECKLENGQGCANGSACLTGNCADGVCCNTACSGTCKACTAALTGGANGVCGNVSSATDPSNECAGVTTCNGSGACTTLTNGTACTLNAECGSGNCIDGVCCNTACGGTCQACNVSGSMGTCTSVPSGTDPAGECNGNGGNDVCNGAGQCKEINGTGCSAGSECLTGLCVDNVCCNNGCSGTCQSCNVSGMAGTCSPIPNGQDPINECSGATTCNGSGNCTTLPTGTGCNINVECASGFCVDSFCCNSACSGTCQACSNAKTGSANGTCDDVLINSDPDNDCAGSLTCDGSGACFKPDGATCSANSECQNGNCVDNICCNVACGDVCASCKNADTGFPDGFCAAVTAGIDPNNDCPGMQVCDGNNGSGACKDPLGSACTGDGTCASGHCSEPDGVCCMTECDGVCQSCDLTGTTGTCTMIPLGMDPDMECTMPQTCNGAGACN